MRKYIFNTSGGNAPDVRFESAKAVCPPAGSGHESTCQMNGAMSPAVALQLAVKTVN